MVEALACSTQLCDVHNKSTANSQVGHPYTKDHRLEYAIIINMNALLINI